MQPAKHIKIPDGSTHFNHSYRHPFEKHVDDALYVYIDGEWGEDLNTKRHSRFGASIINDIEIPKNVKTIKTIFGDGLLLGKDDGRSIVDLIECTDFNFRPVYLYNRDIIN